MFHRHLEVTEKVSKQVAVHGGFFFDPLESVWTSHETLKSMCDVAF